MDLDALRAIVGERHVVTDPDVTASSATDWTGRFRGATPAVVRPGSVDEVAAVVAHCARTGTALVPQGGNTGLVAGGVPLGGELVLSLQRLDQLGPVDRQVGQVTAGAGVTLARVQAAAREAGWAYGVDLAARDSATVGGTIATNAGGLHVLRWGATRRQVLGVEAVLGDGSVIRHLGGLVKDNTGYDLAGLLCGSEGTLGVVTAARLRLVPDLPARVVALVGFEDLDAAVAAVGIWRRHLGDLDAVEVMLADGVELVCRSEGVAEPFSPLPPVVVLVEVAGRRDPGPELADAVGATPGVGATAVAADGPGRRRLWAYRELHTTAINAHGVPHKLDVALPARQLAAFAAEVAVRVRSVAPTAEVWLFGHLGDGNLHVNVTGVEPDDDRVDGAVLELVAAMGGSISAEHGIGRAKARWLHLARTPEELAAFAALRGALDPAGILNPGVLGS